MSGRALHGPWRRLGRAVFAQAAFRFASAVLGVLALLALSASCIASDKPLLARYHGELYVLPNLTDPVALRAHALDELESTLAPGDWLVPTPVPWGPGQQDKGYRALAPPSARHWLGTDTARRDVLARLVHGTRVTLIVGLASVALYVGLGTLLGLFAAFFGGWVDLIISRVTEGVLILPVFFVVLAIMGVMDRPGLGMLVLVMGLTYWTRVTRLVRAEALRVRTLEFIEAAHALGYSGRRIMLRHMLPNVLSPVLVSATFGVAGAVLVEASLSFLGFGAPDEAASWGGLMRGAMQNIHAWWLVIFPGLAIFVTVLALNFAGDTLRDALDPRLSSPTRRRA